MGAKWYEEFKENIRNEMNPHTYGNKMKMKYVSICSCGDMGASSNKAGLQNYIAVHTLFRNMEGHNMQTFVEGDIW